MFSKTILNNSFQEHAENTKIMLFENCYCYLNLVFSVFSVFFKTKEN